MGMPSFDHASGEASFALGDVELHVPMSTHASPGASASGAWPVLSFVEQLEHPACLICTDGTVVGMNAAWREFSPVSLESNPSQQWVQLIHPDDRYEGFSRLHAAATGQKHAGFECRLSAAASGAYRWFMVQLQRLPDSASPDVLLCSCTDIGEIKRREDGLLRRASIQTDMLDVSVDCIKLVALDGTLVHMNKAGCHALGVPEDSRFGMPWLPLLPEDVWEAGERALELARRGEVSRFPGRSVAGGKTQYWDNTLTPVRNANGKTTAILCMSREVTAEHEALESLRASEQRLATAARVGGLGVWDFNVQTGEFDCDAAWHQVMGLESVPTIRSLDQFKPLIHPDDLDDVLGLFHSSQGLSEPGSSGVIAFRAIRPNGDVRWIRSAACLQCENGAPHKVVGFVVDITEAWHAEVALRDANRMLEDEKSSLARQCLEDPLTRLPNRRFLDGQLEHICLRAAESGSPFCVGMIDIDYFKSFNDRYGHVKGDAALAAVASSLQSVMRHADFIARFGGEEFALVLLGSGEMEQIIDRLFDAVRALAIVHEGSPTGYLTVSCGCVIYKNVPDLLPAQLLQVSDEALYAAKESGRNQFVIRYFER